MIIKPFTMYLLSVGLILVLTGLGVFAYCFSDGPGLERKWEGIVADYNYRDVGASLNGCLGAKDKPIFRPGVMGRSNVLFSGWSCENIGNPDSIFSLNYDPKENKLYYCKKPNGQLVVGRHTGIEFIAEDFESFQVWEKPESLKAICSVITEILTDITNGRHVHVHCTAGRDRTGFLVAILSMALAESGNMDRDRMIDAAQCDYRKTETLSEEKKRDNIKKHFKEHFPKAHAVSDFLTAKCGLDARLIKSAASQFFIGDR